MFGVVGVCPWLGVPSPAPIFSETRRRVREQASAGRCITVGGPRDHGREGGLGNMCKAMIRIEKCWSAFWSPSRLVITLNLETRGYP